jgi:hypothetical protein
VEACSVLELLVVLLVLLVLLSWPRFDLIYS